MSRLAGWESSCQCEKAMAVLAFHDDILIFVIWGPCLWILNRCEQQRKQTLNVLHNYYVIIVSDLKLLLNNASEIAPLVWSLYKTLSYPPALLFLYHFSAFFPFIQIRWRFTCEQGINKYTWTHFTVCRARTWGRNVKQRHTLHTLWRVKKVTLCSSTTNEYIHYTHYTTQT